MDYIDSDFLIHSLVNQNSALHIKANDIIEKMVANNSFTISWLNIQEIGFVLAKLDQPVSLISSKLTSLIKKTPVQYGENEFNRAIKVAEIIGFKNFNDCLHTAIAEKYCSDIYTCNHRDFKRIEPYTSLNIHYLQ
jgi:predicted nucleic acid-binding protein